MTTQEIHITYGQIIKLLDRRELKTAFAALRRFVADTRSYMFPDELNSLEETYKQLLYYYTEGSRDPMQAKIYNELTASAYKLADKTVQHVFLRESSRLYYTVRRTFMTQPEDMATLAGAVISSYETDNTALAGNALSLLFKRIWTSGFLTDEEASCLNTAMEAGSIPGGKTGEISGRTVLNCQIVSSLTLALQEFFDKRKFQLLIVAAGSDDREVKIRAYTGILLTLYLYRHRLDCFPEVRHGLEALAEKTGFRKIISMIILCFILSRETEKISNKIRDEIIPEMMKLKPKFNPYPSFGEMSPDSSEEEMNPEWMETLSGGTLGKKMEEFNKLQEEGADVMHSTFVHLKHFSFFNETGNWFKPFLTEHAPLPENDVLRKSLEIITGTKFMCNSDLYSFYFSLRQMPEAGRTMMTTQLENQLSEFKRQQQAELQTRNDMLERIVRQYVQDLYRFYKLYRYRHEFNDIFTQQLDFHNIPLLQPYFSDRDDLMNIAGHYLRKNYFEDALAICERLPASSEGSHDEALFQMTGYCKQMTGDYEGAIADYAKAECINPESKWLLRRMAQCYRALKKPAEAIDCYLRHEKLDRENLSILLSIGSCYLDMKNYTEALRYYFKADYLNVEGNRTWRPVAWCSFLAGRYDQARNYYSKILSHKPDYLDYMNAGHTEWTLQNVKGALELYKKSIEALHGDYEKFHTALHRDIPELAAAGINPAEIPLITDQLRYSLE